MDATEINRNLAIELEKARMVQNMLLPAAFPSIDFVDLAYRYWPFHDISGDFLDYYYKKSSNELGFIICDVSGHGVPSALIAAMMKMALQMWGEYLSDPAGTITKIRNMYKGKLGSYYVSSILGYINMETGLMKCVNAGHPPMLHVTADQQITEIKPAGSIIHEDIDFPYEVFSMQLKPNERLVMYTDGLTEARNDKDIDLETEGLKEILIKNRNNPVDPFCKNIMQDVFSYTGDGERIADDLSLFVIEYKGK